MQHLLSAASRQGGMFATFPALRMKTYAEDPVWKGSARDGVKWNKLSRKEARTIWWEARAMNQTRRGKGLGAVIGQSAMLVLQSLLFDFLNFKTGQLDPSYEGLALKTGLSRATVARSLARLRELRIIHWVRRCSAYVDAGGRFTLEQQRNAYAVLPPTGWRGYVARIAHAVLPHEWGPAPTPRESITAEAVALAKDSGTAALVRALATDPDDPLAAALARLGRSVLGVSKGD